MFYVLSRVFSHDKDCVTYVIVYLLRQQKMGVEVKYLIAALPHPTSLGELTELPRKDNSTAETSFMAGQPQPSLIYLY